MSHIFLKTYYTLVLFILFTHSSFFINTLQQNPDYVMFAYPLSFFSFKVDIFWVHFFIFISALFFCFLCILNPSKHLRVIVSIFILVTLSITFSYGKINHNDHAWMISSVLICFFSQSYLLRPSGRFPRACTGELLSKKNYFLIRLIQGILLSHYFISGLWKLRTLVAIKFEVSFLELVKEYIAYTLMESVTEPHIVLEFFLYKMPWLLSIGYFFILIFQLSSLLPIFLTRFVVFYGFLAFCFHFLTGLVLNIYFYPTVLAVLFFLFITEFFIEQEKKKKHDYY